MAIAEAAKVSDRAAGRTVYEAGAGRRTTLSLAFLILLPFYASLPAMLARRLVHGLWFDTIGLIIFSARLFRKCDLAVGIASARPLRVLSAVGISTFLRENSMGVDLWRCSGCH